MDSYHPAPAEPADDLIDYQDFTELCAKHSFHCDDDESVDQLFELIQEAIAADRARRAAPPAEGKMPDVPPHGYAYRYPDGIRFNNGRTVNGCRPIEAMPYWFSPPVSAPPAEGEVGELVAKLRRLALQNPLGTADPTISRAAALIEQQAAELAMLRGDHPHD